jgi:ferric-dicitrate binding protein FerR (iron transport regulator)
MTEKQRTALIHRYLSGKATEEEKKQVERWYEDFDHLPLEFLAGDGGAVNESAARSLEAVKEKIAGGREKRSLKRMISGNVIHKWLAAAAVAFLVLLSGTVYFLSKETDRQHAEVAVKQQNSDIQPGGNKAVLILGNGRKIVLDSTGNGILSIQGNTRIIKVNSGQLTYSRQSSALRQAQGDDAKVLYNTIATPRGGQYQVVLPDGSKVWLNAASSIRFPTTFVGRERRVQISGEAYFEIAKNAAMPFKVSVNHMTVEVLGTHFNIMAYNDEAAMTTTLVEGSVKVSMNNRDWTMLKPGEQALVNKNDKIQVLKNANVNEAIAWKNNLFWFDSDDVYAVMRQLARWYDVHIDIQGNIPDRFTGSIPRDIAFSKVFEVLQKTGSMHFKIDHDRIIISP